MGYLGLGSALTMMGMRYGQKDSVEFTEAVTRELALEGWRQALEIAKEKGPAPIMDTEFEVTAEMLARRPEMAEDGLRVGDKVRGAVLHARYSKYMRQIATVEPELVAQLEQVDADDAGQRGIENQVVELPVVVDEARYAVGGQVGRPGRSPGRRDPSTTSWLPTPRAT